MRKILDIIEKYIMRLIVISFLVLVLVQAMMTNDPMRFYLSWAERMEGSNIEYPAANVNESKKASDSKIESENVESPRAVFSIVMEDYSSLPKADILINGKKIKSFDEDEILLEVMAGDIIEIDTRAYKFPINFKLIKASDNMAYPEEGTILTANQSIVMLGRVIVK